MIDSYYIIFIHIKSVYLQIVFTNHICNFYVYKGFAIK